MDSSFAGTQKIVQERQVAEFYIYISWIRKSKRFEAKFDRIQAFNELALSLAMYIRIDPMALLGPFSIPSRRVQKLPLQLGIFGL